MFTIPEFYEQYADVQTKEDLFSKSAILQRAEKAALCRENMEELSAFLNFMEEHSEIRDYLYRRFYAAYESGAIKNGMEYEKLPHMMELEEQYAGWADGVLALAAVDVFYAYIEEHGLTDYIERDSYNQSMKKKMCENKIKNGTYGMVDYAGYQYEYAIGIILRIGRLIFEKKKYPSYMEVYKKGNTFVKIALPTFIYGKNGYMSERGDPGQPPVYEKKDGILRGQTYDNAGKLLPDVLSLSLSEYECFLTTDDPVLGIHIPGEGKLTAEAVDASLALAKKVTASEGTFAPKAFVCGSWLMDPQLQTILPESSNIVQFQKRFQPISLWINGYSLYSHIFQVTPCPMEELVPKNKFQQDVLDMIKGGRPLRTGHGFLTELME